MEELASKIRIVLVEPAGPINVGAIARVMKNFWLTQLVLVNPQCDPLSPEALQMAVHADDILQSAVSVETLPEALQGCTRAIATTARVRHAESRGVEHPRIALPWLLAVNEPTALIFGPECRGLSNEELNYAQRFVFIPANEHYSSLNLASAVAVCCYELSQCAATPPETNYLPSINLAPLDAVEGYYQQLEQLLLKIGYLFPHTAPSRMEKFRQIFNRASLQTSEVRMLRGILSQMEWALKRSGEGGDQGKEENMEDML